ncbi:MAG: helix-turn-helix transcriptional regulator [Stellaceae bacterium]
MIPAHSERFGFKMSTKLRLIEYRPIGHTIVRSADGHPAAGGRECSAMRVARGWSQEQLAFESRLHRTYISGVERGVRNPTVVVLQEIASALGVAAAQLLETPPH